MDHSYHSGNEIVSSSLPEETIALPIPNTVMVSTADSSNIAESRPFFSINEWKGFKIVGENIDWFNYIHYMYMLMTLVACYYERDGAIILFLHVSSYNSICFPCCTEQLTSFEI